MSKLKEKRPAGVQAKESTKTRGAHTTGGAYVPRSLCICVSVCVCSSIIIPAPWLDSRRELAVGDKKPVFHTEERLCPRSQ